MVVQPPLLPSTGIDSSGDSAVSRRDLVLCCNFIIRYSPTIDYTFLFDCGIFLERYVVDKFTHSEGKHSDEMADGIYTSKNRVISDRILTIDEDFFLMEDVNYNAISHAIG